MERGEREADGNRVRVERDHAEVVPRGHSSIERQGLTWIEIESPTTVLTA